MIRLLMMVADGIYDLACKVALEYKKTDLHIEVVKVSMDTRYDLAKEYENKRYNAIIARGGIQLLLNKSDINLPIIPIPISVIDVFDAVQKGLLIDKNIAIIAFDNMIVPCESLMRIMNKEFRFVVVKSEDEIEDKIKQLASAGIKVVIGGGTISKPSYEYGLTPIVLQSSRESIISAVSEGVRVSIATIEEKNKLQRLRAIVENSNDGIISVNKHGIIKIFNAMAEKLLKKNADEIIGKSVFSEFDELNIKDIFINEASELEIIKEVNQVKLLVSNIPVKVNDEIMDVITILQDVNKLKETEEKIRREIMSTGFYAKYKFDDIVGNSNISKEMIRIAKDYAAVNSTVLIEGETGTGKEVIAQSIHNYSEVSNGPFVAVNCAAFPENLLESELFGYAPGSFTGADRKGKRGLFELAHGGTIFLDEICEMNPMLQGRLLRVLQEKNVMRVGDNKLMPINVRVIAASNKDLKQLTLKNKFREDLYYRLNVLKIDMPPLRQKVEDIPELINEFMREFSQRLNKSILTIESDAMVHIMSYDWPGNIRELKNFVERIMVIHKKKVLELSDIKDKYFSVEQPFIGVEQINVLHKSNEIDYSKISGEKEKIERCLRDNKGIILLTAKTLGISRSTLWRKMKKYNIANVELY
ncbi:sigma 54-interacting transcriptional regulator [Acidaminobacter hydrogenoformans]|uniref:PAS domain S-box-containing protein n=1 Tax=Acidaminobacter hydrogenoformans DSM 2784 TaxID=1120920 RepID=A0A1G5RQR5_9FIRM|nr:sigma 54-interacting transcriptional regulator [Acidaminobacter hydrogenoformans]SCZ76374.1 PAS domain S-box-containing protein [Acidaminobacter hydrogenoformans DSM 2784]